MYVGQPRQCRGHGISLRKPFSFEVVLAGAHDDSLTFLGFSWMLQTIPS